MNPSRFINRRLISALLFALLFGLAGPSGLMSEAEAKGSKDKKTIKKLKKQSNALRVTIGNLQAQLADARRPVSTPDLVPFIEMVTVGNVGNPTDAGNTDEASVYGAVNYEFQIGKYEVNLDQYTAFLNAVAATDTHDLYNIGMMMDLEIAGIERSGVDESFTYAVIGSGRKPVTYVSWFDAARFCNWLHNGRPMGAQSSTARLSGVPTRWTERRPED